MIKALFHILRIKPLCTVSALVFLFVFSNESWGQSIFDNPITATDPSTANPYTNGQNVNASITASGIGRGTGIVASTALNRYSATGWNSASLNATDYFEFTLTPNAGCEIDFTSFVYTGQASGTGPVSFAIRSSVDGYVSDIGTPNGTGTTINLSAASYQNVTGAITFRFYAWGASASTGTWSINDFTFNGSIFCNTCLEPTVQVSSPIESQIGCNGFNLSWTNGDGTNRLFVVSTSPITSNPVDGATYTANSTYGAGSTIGANQYVVYNGTGSTDYVLGLNANTTYYYKIFEFNYCGGNENYLTSGTVASGDITTTTCSSAAGITAVYIDACGGGCGFEGNNELIWGTTGSYAMNVSNNGPTLHYSSSPTPTVTYISTYVTNAANVTALNAAVGACGTTTFVDPNTLGYIPPNSAFVIANNCMCSPAAYDFSGLCGNGPIYVVFGTNAAWPCNTGGGIFGNGNACDANPRYFDLNMGAWGITTYTPIYNYNPCSLTTGTNGDIITTAPAGGAATTYSNSGCVVPLMVLPIELLDFYATKNENVHDVVWKVGAEEKVSYYILEKSKDGISFEMFETLSLNDEKIYAVVDDKPYSEITYYRLSTKENDGSIKHHKIISVDEKITKWDYNYYQQQENLVIEFKNAVPKNSTISLYDLSGKLLVNQAVKQSQTKLNTEEYSSGIYFVKIASPYKTENFKVVLTK